MADELAKEVAKKETYDENARYSLDIIKSGIHEWLQRQHFRIWNSSEGAMTAKRCRTLCDQRRRHFGEDFRIVEQMRKQDYSDIISFIKDIGITL
jgi:hypothetical protein